MTFLTLDDFKGMKTNFISIDNVKFKRKIIPGDTLIIKSELNSFKRGIAKGSSSGYINDDIACSADFIVSLPDVLNSFKPKN
jgi:3-hydroxyacyl-[acyl-carrier-protein] dehydratase